MSTWEKLPPLTEPVHSGCLNCGSKPITLPLSKQLSVGFGQVRVSRDGETVWSGDDSSVWLRRFEKRAAADPDHDWRVYFLAPLWEGEWQRQGEGQWVAVSRGIGFA